MVVPSGATGVPKNVTGFLQFFTTNPIFAVTDYLRPLIALLRYEATVDLDSDSLRYLFYYLYAKLSSRHKLKSIQYMENHYAEQISVSTLAQVENYNPTYYIGWFKEKTGMTPNAYLNHVRIEKAKELLINTQYRVIDIALQTGYTNGSSFTRAFRRSVGLSPVQYRQKNQVTSNFSKMPYWQSD